jgi:tetratricopeptide (TPR) repeat protein
MQSRSYYHANIGQWQLAVQHGEEAVKLSLIAGDESISAMSRQRLGVAHAMTGNFEQALENLLPIESWIAKSVTAPERQEYYGNVAVAFDNVGRLDEARTMHMRAVSAADGPAYQHQRARHLGNLVVNRLNAGALAEAREHCAVAIQFIETFDLKGGTAAFIRQLQGRCERMLGHYGQALTLFESAYVAVQEKNELLGPVVRLNESLVWMDLGAHDRAAQALQDATQGRSLLPRFEARALVLKARLARVLQHRSHNELEQAAKLAPADGWHDVRWLVACEQAMLQPVDTALATLSRVATDALNRGYRGVALMAHLRACEMAANHDPAKGLRHVRRAMQLCADAEAELLPRIDRWLQPARVLEAVGETEEACDLVRIALRWLNDVALPSLDERWREGLLTRQASNAQLINLAQRLNVKL